MRGLNWLMLTDCVKQRGWVNNLLKPRSRVKSKPKARGYVKQRGWVNNWHWHCGWDSNWRRQKQIPMDLRRPISMVNSWH